eukprot:9357342-Pyramimonas_sp.AAC.1
MATAVSLSSVVSDSAYTIVVVSPLMYMLFGVGADSVDNKYWSHADAVFSKPKPSKLPKTPVNA